MRSRSEQVFKWGMVLIIAVIAMLPAQAQDTTIRHHFSAGIGVTGYGLNIQRRLLGEFTGDQVSASPVGHVAYEITLQDRITGGLSFSYQTASAEKTNTYKSETDMGRDTSLQETVNMSFVRTQVAYRHLIHYSLFGYPNFYSGIRFGVTASAAEHNSDDPFFQIPRQLRVRRFTASLILFGGKSYFNDHLGAYWELQAGAPYIFSGGVVYRI